jgi:hypothetical protein
MGAHQYLEVLERSVYRPPVGHVCAGTPLRWIQIWQIIPFPTNTRAASRALAAIANYICISRQASPPARVGGGGALRAHCERPRSSHYRGRTLDDHGVAWHTPSTAFVHRAGRGGAGAGSWRGGAAQTASGAALRSKPDRRYGCTEPAAWHNAARRKNAPADQAEALVRTANPPEQSVTDQ